MEKPETNLKFIDQQRNKLVGRIIHAFHHKEKLQLSTIHGEHLHPSIKTHQHACQLPCPKVATEAATGSKEQYSRWKHVQGLSDLTSPIAEIVFSNSFQGHHNWNRGKLLLDWMLKIFDIWIQKCKCISCCFTFEYPPQFLRPNGKQWQMRTTLLLFIVLRTHLQLSTSSLNHTTSSS